MTGQDDYRALVQSKPDGGMVQLLAADEAPSEVPAWWIEANAATGRDAVAIALRHWRPVVGARLPQFLAWFERDGTGVFLVRVTLRLSDQSSQLMLLYTLTDPDDPSMFLARLGPLPAAEESIAECWLNLPAELQSFFLTLHDGFHIDLVGQGLHPEADFDSPLGFHDSKEDKDRLPPGSGLDIDDLVGVAGNSEGGELCLDFRGNDDRGWDWYQGSFEAVDFWPALDRILCGE